MRTSALTRLAYAPVFATLLVGCVLDDERPDRFANIESSPRPYFDLYEDSAGKFAFRFASEDHDTLLDSNWYDTRLGALGGVASVLDNGGLAQRYEVVEVGSERYALQLTAGNGHVIAESYLYPSGEAAERGIEAITGAVADYLEYQHQHSGARFEIYADEAGQYYFDLYAGKDDVLLESEPYTSEAAALNGAFSTRENGARPDRFRMIETADGGYYLELRARNGEVLAVSPAFDKRAEAEAGREAIRALVPELPII